MKRQSTARYWLGFILAAVLIHLLLLITVKRSYFSIFLKPISKPSQTETSASFAPDAIITIPITLEDEVSDKPIERVVLNDQPMEDRAIDTRQPAGTSPGHRIDQDDLIGEGEMPLASPGKEQAVLIPPKPLEIAWPDTRGLQQCLGESIELRILVAGDGAIREIAVVDLDRPKPCVDAALAAARKIVFTPGLANGAPAEMWTQIRIDFREKM